MTLASSHEASSRKTARTFESGRCSVAIVIGLEGRAEGLTASARGVGRCGHNLDPMSRVREDAFRRVDAVPKGTRDGTLFERQCGSGILQMQMQRVQMKCPSLQQCRGR